MHLVARKAASSDRQAFAHQGDDMLDCQLPFV
jgi:hypothetical protein